MLSKPANALLSFNNEESLPLFVKYNY